MVTSLYFTKGSLIYIVLYYELLVSKALRYGTLHGTYSSSSSSSKLHWGYQKARIKAMQRPCLRIQ